MVEIQEYIMANHHPCLILYYHDESQVYKPHLQSVAAEKMRIKHHHFFRSIFSGSIRLLRVTRGYKRKTFSQGVRLLACSQKT